MITKIRIIVIVGYNGSEGKNLEDEILPKKKSKDKTIVIVVWRGLVSEVKNLPPGWDYEIDDRDVLEEEMSQEEWDKLEEGQAIPPHRD